MTIVILLLKTGLLHLHHMQLHAEHIINRLCVAGINHTCAAAEVRGLFSVDQDIHSVILAEAKLLGMKSVFVVSTCNRTEIYGYTQHPCELASLLTQFTRGDMASFMEHGYLYQGKQALQHLFRVACGLDSQIIGDYEIQGQLKHAFGFAQEFGMIGPIMDRTINFVFQASKKVRSTTALSTGTVSVSFAAIEWLQKFTDKSPKKILLVGSGKFGRNVCKNIRHYLPACSLTLTNRTATVGETLANEVDASFISFETLATAVNEYDVILVCTNAMEPVIKATDFNLNNSRVIIDLSVPSNVEASVSDLPNTHVVNVDEISTITQSTIKRRSLEIPKAEAIIEEFEWQFIEWLQTYQHAPAIRHIKENLRMLCAGNHSSACEMDASWNMATPADLANDEQIRKTVSMLVYNLKTKKEKGCQFITAYHHFLSREATE
jgi:glutamyl-tRNA reductase